MTLSTGENWRVPFRFGKHDRAARNCGRELLRPVRRAQCHDGTVYAGRLCAGLALLGLLGGLATACDEGLTCHYGRDIEMLKDWAFHATGCLECANGPCECNFYDNILQVCVLILFFP